MNFKIISRAFVIVLLSTSFSVAQAGHVEDEPSFFQPVVNTVYTSLAIVGIVSTYLALRSFDYKRSTTFGKINAGLNALYLLGYVGYVTGIDEKLWGRGNEAQAFVEDGKQSWRFLKSFALSAIGTMNPIYTAFFTGRKGFEHIWSVGDLCAALWNAWSAKSTFSQLQDTTQRMSSQLKADG